jgi:hypothetical protein
MIRYNGIIHLEYEDIFVESLRFLGHIVPTGTRDIISGSEMELILKNPEDYIKLLDLNNFSIDFGNIIINSCTLHKHIDQGESISSLGFLQGFIEREEDCLKMLE